MTVAELVIVLFEGIDVTRTLKDKVTFSSAGKVPIVIPVSGRIFGNGIPLIVTLFSINVVPVGIVSKMEVLIVGIGE